MLYTHTPSRLSYFSSLVLGFVTLVFSAAALGAAWLKVETKVGGSSFKQYVFVSKGVCEDNDASVDNDDCNAWMKKKYYDGTDFEDDGMILWPLSLLLTFLVLLITLAAFITVLLCLARFVTVKRTQKIVSPMFAVATVFALAAALLAFTSNMTDEDKWNDYFEDQTGAAGAFDTTVSLDVGFFLVVLTFLFSLINTLGAAFPGFCGLCKTCTAEEAPFKSMV